MKIDVKSEQKKFWKAFDLKMIENGDPFSILHEKSGETTYWAVVNKKYSLVDNALSLDFLVRQGKLRVNIYIRCDLSLYSVLESHRQEIEAMVSVPLKWLKGTRNLNTRRIAYEFPIKVGNDSNYEEVIDDILPIVVEMKKVCEKYAPHAFFDF